MYHEYVADLIQISCVLRHHKLDTIKAALMICGKSSTVERKLKNVFHLMQICVKYH